MRSTCRYRTGSLQELRAHVRTRLSTLAHALRSCQRPLPGLRSSLCIPMHLLTGSCPTTRLGETREDARAWVQMLGGGVRRFMAPTSDATESSFLTHCTRCGRKVSPYRPSELSLNLTHKYGEEPPEVLLMAEPHYWCGHCAEHWLATNLLDTGTICPCGAFTPLSNRYCGACGRPTRA